MLQTLNVKRIKKRLRSNRSDQRAIHFFWKLSPSSVPLSVNSV